MSILLRVLLATFGCIVFCAESFAGGPFGIIHVGKWQGAAYTTNKGAFSHCTAAAKFDNGLAIILAENANRSWIIGVTAPSWSLRDEQSVKLILTFDGQAQFDVSGTAARDKAVPRKPKWTICKRSSMTSPAGMRTKLAATRS